MDGVMRVIASRHGASMNCRGRDEKYDTVKCCEKIVIFFRLLLLKIKHFTGQQESLLSTRLRIYTEKMLYGKIRRMRAISAREDKLVVRAIDKNFIFHKYSAIYYYEKNVED